MIKKKAIKKVSRKMYEEGGDFPASTIPGAAPTTAVTPVTDVPPGEKKRLTASQIRKKYATNPYVKGRETWGADLDMQIPASDQTARQAILQASKATGVNPALLYTSASEEGLNLALHRPGMASEAYVNWSDKNPQLGEQYPVDGFYNYGLDTFGNNYSTLVKKGYLPKDFNKKFTTFDIENEKGETYKSAAFASDADALTAKAALIRDSQDAVAAYEKKSGTKLTDKQKEFFALAGYNGGNGIIPKMAASYAEKGYLKDDKFLDSSFKPASYGGVYTNVQRRLQNKAVLENEGYFADGGPFNPQGTKLSNDPWAVIEQPTPQRPNSDPLAIYPVDQSQGTPVQQDPIQPLSQFYDIINSEFGNKKLQGTGQYVNAQGQINTPEAAQAQANQVSEANAKNADRFSGIQKGIETAATFAISGINRVLGEGNAQASAAKLKRQQLEQQSLASNANPYLQGTGSQAIYKYGGSLESALTEAQGVQVLDGGKAKLASTSDHSNPMMEFTGKEHKEGGIGIAFNGGIAEVENKEMGWVDDRGTLQLFGKLKVPGTNQTFRKVAKDIAQQEKKVDDKKGFYLKILNGANEADRYAQSAISTAKVMFKSLDKQSKEIAEQKEAISSYQSLILNMKTEREEANVPKFAEGGSFSGDEDLKKLMAAIAKFESNGNPSAKGKTVTKGSYKGQQAIGKYQIMEGNISAWSKEALGKSVTPAEFLASEDIQDKVAAYKIGQIYKNNPDPADVASIWFTGKKASAGAGAKDDNGTSGSQYVNQVVNIYRKNGGKATSNYAATQGDPDPKFKLAGASFNKTDAKSMYEFALKNEEHGLNSNPKKMAELENFLGIHANARRTPEGVASKSLSNSTVNQLLTAQEQGNTYQFRRDQNPGLDTPYGKATVAPTPNLGTLNIGNGDRVRGKVSPLDLTQIAPELMSLATNRQEPVFQPLYQPDLKQTFDISYQLGRNENQSTFNQAAKIAQSTGDISALSQLAAQKYNADQQYNNQEIQGNAQQKLQTYSQNVDTLNDAKLKNLQLLTTQADKQAAAKFNTRKEDLAAFSSIEGKVLQNNLENRQYNAYANLFKHYGFDKNGNVTFDPDKVTQVFNEGERQQFGMLAAQKGVDSILNGGNAGTKTITTTDGSGNVKKITNIDSDLEEFNTIMSSKNLDETQKKSILSKRRNAIFQDLN